MKNNLKHYIKITLLTSSILSAISANADDRIKSISVAGNHRIEQETIKSYLDLHVGQNFTTDRRIDAIKRLYATSMFENVYIDYNDGRLVVHVVEAPFITKVEIKGNNKIKSATLSKEVMTKAGDSLSKTKIHLDVDRMLETYKRSGRFAVNITPQIKDLGHGKVKVIFEVTEGPKASIRHIYFAGNNHYRSSELRSVILTKETAWYKFMDTNDTYDPERMEYDVELLKQFYQSVGFADVQILSATAELSPTKEYFTATYSIAEGPKYKIGNVTVQNRLDKIDNNLVEKYINIKSGEVFNMSALEKTAEKISDELSNKGYPQVSVYPEIKKNFATNTADVVFIVEKANTIFVDKINISGNPRTSDSVIRREFSIQEGDVFNRSRITNGERGLRNLDYFEKVNITVTPTNNVGRYDVNVDVVEKSTASIGFDLGYSTAEGIFGNLSYNERNLLGTGKYFNMGTHRAKKRVSYTVGLTDPHFYGKDVSLGGTFFNIKSGNSGNSFGEASQPYSLNTYGIKTTLGYPLAEDLTHDIDYTIKKDKLSIDKSTTSIFIAEQVGKFTTSAIGQSLTYDRTDNKIIPKNGYILSASQEYAGVGGNNHYLKHEVDGKYFKSFVDNKLTLKLVGSAGDVFGTQGKQVRISDRFQVGDYNLRGFAPGGIGPRDKRTGEGLGGLKYYTFTTELNFPVGLPEEMNFTGAIFSDVGGLWGVKVKPNALYTKEDIYNSRSPRASVGLGFLWITRIAPIRVDWALPVKKKSYDETQHWHIRFSTHF